MDCEEARVRGEADISIVVRETASRRRGQAVQWLEKDDPAMDDGKVGERFLLIASDCVRMRQIASGLTAHGPGAARPFISFNRFGSAGAEWLSRRSETGQKGLYTHHGTQTDNTGPQDPTWPPLWLLGPPTRASTTHDRSVNVVR